MSVIVNKSSAMISAKLNGSVINLVPGSLVTIGQAELKKLKEIPLISRSFDSGLLISGAGARVLSREAEKESEDRESSEGKGEE